jgi:hypothetical protein
MVDMVSHSKKRNWFLSTMDAELVEIGLELHLEVVLQDKKTEILEQAGHFPPRRNVQES